MSLQVRDLAPAKRQRFVIIVIEIVVVIEEVFVIVLIEVVVIELGVAVEVVAFRSPGRRGLPPSPALVRVGAAARKEVVVGK